MSEEATGAVRQRSFMPAIARNPKLARIAAGALDPIVSSATVFLVQAALLATADKAEFGRFSLAYSYVVMGQAILSSLFGGPLVTLLSRRPDDSAREQTGNAILKLQLIVSVALAGAGLLVAIALKFSPVLALLVVAGLIGVSFRDALRSVLTVQLRVAEALVLTLIFAAMTLGCLGVDYAIWRHVGALSGLLALALGANLTLSPRIFGVLRGHHALCSRDKSELARMAAWSLPGAIVVWLQNSFYLTLVAINIELGAAAEISAARMTIMPILICSTGLLRLYQVQVARNFQNKGLTEVAGNAARVALTLLVAGVLLADLVWLASGHVPARFIPHAHPHIVILSAAWLLFAASSVARGVYSSLLQALGRYRELFMVNAIFMPMVLIGIVEAPRYIGLVGAILPMALGEVGMLIVFATLIHKQSGN